MTSGGKRFPGHGQPLLARLKGLAKDKSSPDTCSQRMKDGAKMVAVCVDTKPDEAIP